MEASDSRLRDMQKTVDEVTVIMHDNLNKTEERSEKLQDLDKRADLLRTKSQKFHRTTVKVKRKTRWENSKMKLLLVAAILVGVVVLIIVIAVLSSGGSSTQEPIQRTAITTQAPGGSGAV